MNVVEGWVFWALLSAVFAAATTVFARIGVAGVDADLATFLRTVLILQLLADIRVVQLICRLHSVSIGDDGCGVGRWV